MTLSLTAVMSLAIEALPAKTRDEADSGAFTLIQRFGSAANLNIHLHCLLLDGIYLRSIDGAPEFVEALSPTDQVL